jgi:hypothetical protein
VRALQWGLSGIWKASVNLMALMHPKFSTAADEFSLSTPVGQPPISANPSLWWPGKSYPQRNLFCFKYLQKL